MICLPGILSQGGKKFIWKKYSLVDGPVAGTPATVERTPTYRKKTATAYTFSGTTFSLSSSKTTYFNAMKKGQFLVDVANTSSYTKTTGTTLYELTKDASSVVETNLVDNSGGWYSEGDTLCEGNVYTSVTVQNNQFVFSGGPTSLIASNSLPANKNYYEKISSTKYVVWSRMNQTSGNQSLYSKMTYELVETTSISYIPYTIQKTMGSYIEDVVSKEPTTFPDNGVQDGFWYVKV